MDRLLPGATLALTNTRSTAKYEVRADAAGRFEFVGLPPATYQLETRLPGFAVLRGTVTITGQDVQQDLKLDIGSLEETITITLGGAHVPVESRNRRPLPPCTNATAAGEVGGRIRPPVMIRRVSPEYPGDAQDAAAEEVVVVNARIATDGSVKETTVVPPAHPGFAEAAVDAIRQWQYDETLLNCTPVEVLMKVTARFRRP
jgi:TonB family protein